jgi:MFS family permease
MTRARCAARPATAGSATIPGTQLAVLLVGAFMAQFDFFVVNVAAPAIRSSLSATAGELELIIGGYAFAYATGLVLGGRLGDLFGHRRLYISGMLAFAVTSSFCGLAGGPLQLVAARLLQGAAAAVTLPQVLAIISKQTHGTGRGRAMAWYGVAGGVGSLAGQVLGGLLITADLAGLGWRVIFLVNLPIGVVGAVAAKRVLAAQSGSGDMRRTLDFGGAAGLAVGAALLLVPLTLGRDAGWPWWTWAGIGSSLPVLAVTVRWQRALERAERSPLLPVRLFGLSTYRVGVIAVALFMAFFASYMLALSVLLQDGYELNPFGAGVAFAPSATTFTAGALLAPRLAARVRWSPIVGGALMTAGALVVLAVVSAGDGGHHLLGIVVATAAVVSLGNGAVLPSLTGLTLAQVPSSDAGAAAGALATAQQFAGAAGVGLLGTVFFAASGSSGPAGDGHGMLWVAAIDAAISLVIAACGARLHRRGDSEPRR